MTPVGGGGAAVGGAVADAVAGADAGAEDGAGAAADAAITGVLTVAAGKLGAWDGRGEGRFGLDSRQRGQARQASRCTGRERDRERDKLGQVGLNGLDRVAELVCEQSADVGQQLRPRRCRVGLKFPEVAAQGLEYLQESVDPPTQLVRIPGVIVDDVSAVIVARSAWSACMMVGAESVGGAAATAAVETA